MASTKRKRKNGRAKLSWTDLICTGPGTLAGKYMRMFWHPVYRAEDLPAGKAKPIRIMGEDFTLYRGTGGTPHVVAFRCAHRGTQLSAGWVEGDCIRCMYHGWLYDSKGQCVEQPAEEESFAKKIRIRSYPTEEYLGLIFAYLGEGISKKKACWKFFPCKYGHATSSSGSIIMAILSTFRLYIVEPICRPTSAAVFQRLQKKRVLGAPRGTPPFRAVGPTSCNW
jgi:nitrite reductase/ring-hydroxylating ferredoxin subunit